MEVSCRETDDVVSKKLPLTLLSGFLGAGKTTLLKHILRNTEDMKVCVIVNDMAALNIDASLIKGTKLIQTEERLVEMQNGCICCTLREDLLQEVAALARSGKFDYLVIESTGIGEPMQVAETFTMNLDEEGLKMQPLHELAVLDTCVTVVDAANLWMNIESMESLRDRGDAAHDEDDRNVADLLLDQIEFANVIILNKIDLVQEDEKQKMLALLRALNPVANILESVNSEVPLHEVVATKLFSFEDAARSAGWLQSLQGTPHVPETEEYGISHFIYKSRLPFDPKKIYTFLNEYFVLQEPDWSSAIAANRGEQDAERAKVSLSAAVDHLQVAKEALQSLFSVYATPGIVESAMSAVTAASYAVTAASQAVQQVDFEMVQRVDNIATQEKVGLRSLNPLKEKFGNILRSKGFVWLASRPDLCGEWSQSGGIVRFTVGGPWYASLPQEAWPQTEKERQDIKKDFEGPFGDRRQELVFIGIDMKKDTIRATLDSFLVDEPAETYEDPFAPWPSLEDIMDAEDEEVDQTDELRCTNDNIHDDNKYLIGTPSSTIPGALFEITEGASEAQTLLDGMKPGITIFIHWYADWHAASSSYLEILRTAITGRDASIIHVDISKYYPNWSFAMEKIMRRPEAKRVGAKPILKDGTKWPCFTVHEAPSLQPTKTVSGPGAMDTIMSMIQDIPKLLADPKLKGSQGRMESDTSAAIANEAVAANQAPPERTTVHIPTLTNGAIQLRQVLQDADGASKEVYIIWENNHMAQSSGLIPLMETMHSQGKLIYRADVEGSKGNTALSKAFAVNELPSLFVFHKMKVVKKVSGLEGVQVELRSQAGSSITLQPESLTSRPSTISQTEPNKQHNGTISTSIRSIFDPPEGKGNKSGATKMLNDGRVVHFYPKMPCLRCGCPWWTSDDWDARCIRCKWDCERDGYDDDSRPLPGYKDKWTKFVNAIKEGKAPAWKGT